MSAINLMFSPENVELHGMVFEQTSFTDGVQSVGFADDAAFVEGKNHKGDNVKVYLEINQSLIEKQKTNSAMVIPTLSNTSPKLALLEQMEPVEGESNVFVAKWRSELQEKGRRSRSGPPVMGVGRMEIDYGMWWYNTPVEVSDLMRELAELKDASKKSETPLEYEDKIAQVEAKLIELRRFRVRTVYALHDKMVKMDKPDEASVTEAMTGFFNEYSKQGFQSGVICRVMKGGKVKASLCFDVRRTEDWRRKDLTVKPPMPIDEVLEGFFKYGGSSMVNQVASNDDMELHLIPELIINCGPRGVGKYKEYHNYKKLMSTYFDHKGMEKSAARVVVSRLYEGEMDDENDEEPNYILSSSHAISDVVGHFLELDENFNKVFEISYDGVDYDRFEKNLSKKGLFIGRI